MKCAETISCFVQSIPNFRLMYMYIYMLHGMTYRDLEVKFLSLDWEEKGDDEGHKESTKLYLSYWQDQYPLC